MYPLVFFDALRAKIREEGLVRNKAVYVALGVTPEGTKDILGLWIETSEGAKFWLRVTNELKNRGVNDILIAVVDGLKGSGRNQRGIPANDRPDLRRASHSQFHGFCLMEGAKDNRGRAPGASIPDGRTIRRNPQDHLHTGYQRQ